MLYRDRERIFPSPAASAPPLPKLFERICVRPPYFALTDVSLAGLDFSATAVAEAPAYLEKGPMTAAELGRHAAIAGVAHAALSQSDDRRRYYLARRAECRYASNPAPYGAPVRLASRVLSLNKRDARVAVSVTAEGAALAQFEVDYAILTEPTFDRLFRTKAQETQSNANPYRSLLREEYARGPDWVEQEIAAVPPHACAGHFEGYPALPVAILMGQLAYLAGQLVDEAPRPFRIVHGLVEADDLAWAGESVRFRVVRTHREGAELSFSCEASAGGRPVGSMHLQAELVE